jgi:predicted permease
MNWFQRRKAERELDEEIREHIEIETRENIERGMPADRARYAAMRKFGNTTRVKEQVHDMRMGVFFETVAQDALYAIRMLRRSPGFTMIAVASLALGIAVNSAIFTAICASLFPTAPYKDADGIVLVHSTSKTSGPFAPVSFAEYEEIKRQSTSLSDAAAATSPSSFNTSATGDLPERMAGLRVTTNLFPFLGVAPVLGRDFTAGEDKPGHDHVILISSGFWNRRFESSPHVLGRPLKLNGEWYSIIGVLPSWFSWLGSRNSGCGDPVGEHYCLDVFVPVSRENPPHNLTVLGRLNAGVSREQARAEMAIIAQRLDSQRQADDRGRSFGIARLFDMRAGLKGQTAIILQCSVAFALLIACANVANLLLVRATGRAREIALRCAIGARRKRVVRQLTTEGLILGIVGGALGLLLTPVVVKALAGITGIELLNGTVDYRVVLFTAASVIVTALLFALAPAIHGARADVNQALKAGAVATCGGAQRLRNCLVAFEIALATVLLIGATLFGRSVVQYSRIDPGFNVRDVVFAIIPLSDQKYRDETLRRGTVHELLEKARTLPGIASAAVVSGPPLYSGETVAVRKEDDSRPANELPTVRYRAASADYFRMLGVRIVHGRDFRASDADSTVAIVNDVMAREFWPDESPIGKQISIVTGSKQVIWREVIGVMPDMRDRGLVEEKRAQIVELNSVPEGSPWLMVRTVSDPRNFVRPLRQAVANVDKDQPIASLQTMQQAVARQYSEEVAGVKFFGLFAALALLLAAFGIYGVVAYFFAQRRQEMGVRLALGAGRSQIYRVIFGQSLKIAIAGITLGLLLSAAVTRFIRAALYEVSPTDPATFAGAALVLLGVAIFAAWAPARRAARVDPIEALRYE